MNDDLYLRAGAYLDRELDDEVRRSLEADAESMRIVDDLQRLRSLVRNVTPPRPGEPERVIATAMAAFAGPADRREPARRTAPTTGRLLGVAAATIAVLGAGLVVARSLQRPTSEDETLAEPARLEMAADEAVPQDGDLSSSRFASDDQVAAAPMDDPLTGAEAAASALEAPAEEPAEEPATEVAEATVAARIVTDDEAADEQTAMEFGPVLTMADELSSYGAVLLEASDSGTLPPTPNHSCPVDEVLGRTEFLVDGSAVEVLIAVDPEGGVASAFDADSCELVAEAPLPEP